MANAANQEGYGNPWGPGPQGWQGHTWRGQGWQGGQGAGGQGPGWQGSGWQGSGWAPPFWYPVGISRPMAVLFTVLGFIFWWPVGLAILAYMLFTGRIGCRARAWQMAGQQQQSGDPSAPGGWRSGGPGWSGMWKNWCGGEPPAAGRSSGNHAFDEYKAETLRRLEEEQQEFAAFLDRLRFAKDKAEFDQFMADRRQRPASESPPPVET
jgi:hypothetical protein